MSAGSAEIRQKLGVAGDLRGVVRTMKAIAAASIGQYEQAVRALIDYDRVVRLGLSVALREVPWRPAAENPAAPRPVLKAIVLGSDQGLVGQFNDVIADYALSTLAALPGSPVVWAVGERVHARLADAGLAIKGVLQVPNDVSGIVPLVGRLQLQTEFPGIHEGGEPLYVFHNRPRAAAGYEPVSERLLPLDAAWRDSLVELAWPGKSAPQLLGDASGILTALVREYLFISLTKACSESLASENASRLAAMQRAEKNIDELTEELTRKHHRLRQQTIDEELFDVVAGFEAASVDA